MTINKITGRSFFTLKAINKIINTRFPFVELVKGEGYFYVSPNDRATEKYRLFIAGLFTTSIGVYTLNEYTPERWLEAVATILKGRDEEGLGGVNYFELALDEERVPPHRLTARLRGLVITRPESFGTICEAAAWVREACLPLEWFRVMEYEPDPAGHHPHGPERVGDCSLDEAVENEYEHLDF